MIENVKVVVLPEAKEEAYNMGYDEFSGIEADNPEDTDLAPFRDSARYCNHILPRLRAMSGFFDRGHGTYQEGGKVVVVDYPGDRPMGGEITETRYVLDEIIEAWDTGAYDALDGYDRYTRFE